VKRYTREFPHKRERGAEGERENEREREREREMGGPEGLVYNLQ